MMNMADRNEIERLQERIATLERDRSELVEALRMMVDGQSTLRYVNANTLLSRLSASGKGAV